MKYKNLEKKEGKYAKPLAKIQVTAIFLKQDMRRNDLTKFIDIAMEIIGTGSCKIYGYLDSSHQEQLAVDGSCCTYAR